MSTIIEVSISLPGNFRAEDFLAFHRRDDQMIAEIVDEYQLQKGIIWQDQPACIKFSFTESQVTVELHLDSKLQKLNNKSTQFPLQQHAEHMLGLNQSINDFETYASHHPQLTHLVKRQSGLRVPQAATTFEALTWAIIGQQISLHAAISVRRKFIQRAGLKHSSGIWCYPSAEQITFLEVSDLRPLGFSQSKAAAIIALSRIIQNGDLPLDDWLNGYWKGNALPAKEIFDALINMRGIGPWTANYALLRGFGWLDGSLHGDVAVRRNLQQLLQSDEKIDEKTTQAWLVTFAPWRALVAAHLWAMQKQEGF